MLKVQEEFLTIYLHSWSLFERRLTLLKPNTTGELLNVKEAISNNARPNFVHAGTA